MASRRDCADGESGCRGESDGNSGTSLLGSSRAAAAAVDSRRPSLNRVPVCKGLDRPIADNPRTEVRVTERRHGAACILL